MQLFIELNNGFTILGMEANQKNKFNRKHLLALSLFVYSFGSIIAFILFESLTFTDSSKAILGALTILLNFFTLYSNVSKQNKIFDLIDRIGSIINDSKQYQY